MQSKTLNPPLNRGRMMTRKCGSCGDVIKDFRGYAPEYGSLCLKCYKQLFSEEGVRKRTIRSFGYGCLPKDLEKQ